jgi:hypothetical protein
MEYKRLYIFLIQLKVIQKEIKNIINKLLSVQNPGEIPSEVFVKRRIVLTIKYTPKCASASTPKQEQQIKLAIDRDNSATESSICCGSASCG